MLHKTKKTFSQNWLVDQMAVKKMIDAARIVPGERVVEIGPGTGVITRALVEAGAQVTAIEIDRELIGPLRDTFGNSVELIHGDALSLSSLPTLAWLSAEPYKLVSSLPYNITSEVLRKFLTTTRKPSRIVLMLQKEVVERIVAKPPDMTLLSVVCQLYARCEKIALVKAGAFRPIPKVDSSIVRLDTYPDGNSKWNGLNPEQVIKIARAGFSAKRKQLRKNLPYPDARERLARCGLDPHIRAQNLTVDEWVCLVG